MDSDFDNVTWQTEGDGATASPPSSRQAAHGASPATPRHGLNAAGASGTPASAHTNANATSSTSHSDPTANATPPQPRADAVDLAGIGSGILECTVDAPLKEGGGGKDAYISYRVTTHTDFKSFQKPDISVRRRFTDFVFLYKSLARDYPACAVPPLPDKHKMEYVRGDRFGSDFTSRRAYSLQRFLRRLTLHPVLRRSTLLTIFLESPDWNAHMRLRPGNGRNGGPGSAGNGGSNDSGNSMFDSFADTFVNAFSKVHKPDRRFIEVKERADKLDEDLGHVEKLVARVARRETDLEADYGDLATQFLKLAALEAGVEAPVHAFARSVEATATGLGDLRAHTDQDYLGSLRDMSAYVGSMRGLLKTREQKQLDFEGLSEYLAKAAHERDSLASQPSGHPTPLSSPTGFLRSKLEDARGVDPEQARRDRVRRLELQIERLTREVEDARRTAELFDDEVVKEVADLDRIRAAEFRDTLGALAARHVTFYSATIDTWEAYVRDMEAKDARRQPSVRSTRDGGDD